MFSTAVEVVLHIAFREAVSRRHAYLTLEHLLFALAHDPDGERILGACGADLPLLRRKISDSLESSIEALPRGQEREPEQTTAFRRALQAAVLRVKAPRLEQWTEGRRRNARRYRELFERQGLAGRIGLPEERSGCFHIYNQYVVRVPERDRVKQLLAARNVGTAVYYPVPFHLQPCFRDLGYQEGAFPHAEAAAREVLALPVHPALTEAQQERVVASIERFFGEGTNVA